MTTRQQLDDLCQRHTEIPVVSAPDTDGGRNGVLSRDKQINVAFADGKGVPPLKVQKIGQVNKVAKSDSSVPVTRGLYGYC